METRKRFSYVKIYVAYGFLMSLIGNGSFATAISITVTDLECVSEQVLYQGDTISGNFVAIDHDIFWSADHPGIDFTATTPGGNIVFSLKGTSGDKFEFKAPQSGIYKFCFRNPVSTPETVSFYIHVGHIPNEHDLAKDGQLVPVADPPWGQWGQTTPWQSYKWLRGLWFLLAVMGDDPMKKKIQAPREKK